MLRATQRPQGRAEWARAADLVLKVTARAFAVTTEELRQKSRSRASVAYARQVAMYLMHVVFGGTYQEVGQPFGRERTTVAYACSLIEDDRDEASLDRRLDDLESELERLWTLEQVRADRVFSAAPLGRAAA